ncbi:Uncharacterised protein [Mycobacteroides abscessus subsp. abscessus]|nr:Uncharacterised protein [Mycobacteroides abscessus subsp. abscessus]
MRDAVGDLIQLAIGPRPVPAHQCDGLRRALHLDCENHRDRDGFGGGLGEHRAVTPFVETVVIVVVEKIHRQQSPGGIGAHVGSFFFPLTSDVMASSTRWNLLTNLPIRTALKTSVSNSTRSPSSWPGVAWTASG